MVRRPAPISLRLRNAEATRRARALLLRLSEDEKVQRRIKWRATKSLIEFNAMSSTAAARLERMSPGDRSLWQAQCKQVQAFLEKIIARGLR